MSTETPEWPTAGNGCECWVNPNPWTYYGIPEPGDCLEYNPDCPEHGEAKGMTEQTYTREDMARAWDEGHGDGYRDAQDYRSSGGAEGCGPDSHDCDYPNPYMEEV